MAEADTDIELLLLRQKQLSLQRQKVQAIKDFGLAYYRPHEKQALFHRSPARWRCVRAGNRWGKSMVGCTEDCAWLIGERPWEAPGSPERTAGIPRHPVKLLVITTDWGKSDEVFTSQRGEGGKIWKLLPRGWLRSTQRNHAGVIETIDGKNGSLLRFDTVRSWATNPQGTESSDWDAIHVDEPCPKGMWLAASRGLIDRGGRAWFTMTPLSEPWINDFFTDPGRPDGPPPDTFMVEGTTYDNPFLSPEDIVAFESTLSPDEVQCRIYGIPLSLAGLVYKAFDREVHILKTPPVGWHGWTPGEDWSVYVALDVHYRTPHAALFVAVGPDGHHVYYEDMFIPCTIAELVEKVKERLVGRSYVRAICDPLGFIDHPITATSMATEMARAGLPVTPSSKARAQGISRVQTALKECTISFTPECRRTLWEIQRYSWDSEKDRPVDEDDHMMENLYRLEIEGIAHVPKPTRLIVPRLTIRRPRFDLAFGGRQLRAYNSLVRQSRLN